MAEAVRDTVFPAARASTALGARIEGVDLAVDADAQLVTHLHDLLLEHHLLVLPGQTLSPLELADFGRLWGSLLTHPATRHQDTEFVQWIARKGRKHSFFPGEHPFGGGWHSDMTWHHDAAPIITALHAQRATGRPAATRRFRQSTPRLRRRWTTRTARSCIEPRCEAFHTGKVFGPDVEDSFHPVVRTHDETGRARALRERQLHEGYILRPARRRERAAAVQALRPRHPTGVRLPAPLAASNDLVLWDNRSVMHYAIADYSEERVMHRIVVQGGKPR